MSLSFNQYVQGGELPLPRDDKRAVYEQRIKDAQRVTAETLVKIEALPKRYQNGFTFAKGLPADTQLFLPLNDIRLGSDGCLYLHPQSTLSKMTRSLAEVALVRVRSKSGIEITVSKNAKWSLIEAPSNYCFDYNRVTKVVRV